MAAAREHEVWVLTRANNQPSIERALRTHAGPAPRFRYWDFSSRVLRWKKGAAGAMWYYWLWQWGTVDVLRRIAAENDVDLVHHVTFARYWTPASATRLGLPFVLGPVGGGEGTGPRSWEGLPLPSKAEELLRLVVRAACEHLPPVRAGVQRASVAAATTAETAERLRAMGAESVLVVPAVGIPVEDWEELSAVVEKPEPPVILSVGQLLPLKRIDLGLRALAETRHRDWLYRIVGDGPDRSRLEGLAKELGISERVLFTGWQDRGEMLEDYARAHALLHPSLRESGSMACLEAMAAGLPVVHLATGGPALLVPEEAGIGIPPASQREMVAGFARAIDELLANAEMARAMGRVGRARAESLRWDRRVETVNELYDLASRSAR